MAAQKVFSTSLVSTCIESNSRFFQSFRPRKSLFLPFSKEKHVLQAACFVPRKVFYVHSAIDHLDPGVDYELPRNKPCTTLAGLLRYLCLAGFLCGYSLHTATMAYAGESDEENENCVRVNSSRHKGRFPSKRHLSVMKNLAKTSKSSMRKQHESEEEELEPPRKIVTRLKQVMYILFCTKHCCYKKLQISQFLLERSMHDQSLFFFEKQGGRCSSLRHKAC